MYLYCMFLQGSTENQLYWVDSLIKYNNYNYNYPHSFILFNKDQKKY